MSPIGVVDRIARRFRAAAVGVVLSVVSMLAACQTSQQMVSQHEDNLAAAGFMVRPANTPERQAMLSRLPPNRFVVRAKGDSIHYVYSDPQVCHCLYVGSQRAYDQYKRDQQRQHLADDEQMTAAAYTDAAWKWDAWGPWGPGYGFGYGPGYGW